MGRHLKKIFSEHSLLGLIIIAVLLINVVHSPVFAQTSSSPEYSVDEYFFGTGGELEACSGGTENYCAQNSAGSLSVGRTSGTLFDAEAGFITTNEPFLVMVVTGATVPLGLLSPSSTSSGAAQAGDCSCSFTVRTYRSSGYGVYTMSQPPSQPSYTLTAKAAQGLPSTDDGVEEFGINLVANTALAIGSNPDNVPDGTFADGGAETGYDTDGEFKYGVGDLIASSAQTAGAQAVGQTDYTVSYIAKSNGVTPAGLYTMAHDIVVVATY